MATTITEGNVTRGVVGKPGAWVAETEEKVFFVPTGKVGKGGKEQLRRVVVRSIHLTRDRGGCQVDAIKFTVTKRNGQVTIGDHRETQTGVTRGLWGTRDATPAGGKVKQLSPAAWVAEVTRLIGAERARQVLAEIGA